MFKISKRRKKQHPKTMRALIRREMRISIRKIFVGTPYLTPVSEKDMHEFLAIDRTDELKYIDKVQECDHFALYLLANAKKWFIKKYKKNAAVGQLWICDVAYVNGHAINFFVTPEYKVRYIEPQTDAGYFPSGRKLFVQI